MFEEEPLIKKVKTSFSMIIILLGSPLILLGVMLILSMILSMLFMFLAFLSSFVVIVIFLLYFWKQSFSTKLDKSNEKEIIEIINKYRKKVKPCIFIGIIALIGFFLTLIFGRLLPLTYFYQNVLSSIFLFFALLTSILFFLGVMLNITVNEYNKNSKSLEQETTPYIENLGFKDKLTKYFNEIWEKKYNPTLKDIENNLNVINKEQKIVLKEILGNLFNKNKINCIYDKHNQVYRFSKKSSTKSWIFVSIIFIPMILILVLSILYPSLEIISYWTEILLIIMIPLVIHSILDKLKKKKIQNEFFQMSDSLNLSLGLNTNKLVPSTYQPMQQLPTITPSYTVGKRFCTNCGEPLKGNERFCTSCGFKI